ncbi:MAG: hypothetical protein MUC50_04430 [Myxococcota bacterium]|jgi:hypothetical protein|nr:hypothetical protein [Myxococcota bacterium]
MWSSLQGVFQGDCEWHIQRYQYVRQFAARQKYGGWRVLLTLGDEVVGLLGGFSSSFLSSQKLLRNNLRSGDVPWT